MYRYVLFVFSISTTINRVSSAATINDSDVQIGERNGSVSDWLIPGLFLEQEQDKCLSSV